MAVFVEERYHDDRIHVARNMIATGRNSWTGPAHWRHGVVMRRITTMQRLFRKRASKIILQQELGRNVRRKLTINID